MYTKIAVVTLFTLILGGCTLTDYFKPNQSATDQQSPDTTMVEDQTLEAMPSTSSESDVDSLEADINSTVILEEDFSDLE